MKDLENKANKDRKDQRKRCEEERSPIRDPIRSVQNTTMNEIAGTLTDRNKQGHVSSITNPVLQTVDDDRGQHGLARARLTRERQRGALALQEPSQVWGHPQAGQFLALVGKMRSVLCKVVEDAVFGGQPGTDGLDRHYAREDWLVETFSDCGMERSFLLRSVSRFSLASWWRHIASAILLHRSRKYWIWPGKVS